MAIDVPPIFTIGHSNHSINRFVELLRLHGVTAVADVRSAPFSRYNPQFNRDALAESLHDGGIAYVFLGQSLGARSDDPAVYENGRVRYRKLAATPLFHSGIERVKQGARKHRIALMCAEKDPLHCHRTLLVSRALEHDGVAVSHILADGGIETQHAAMRRLLGEVGASAHDMFDSEDALIEKACMKREEDVAYQDEHAMPEAGEVTH